jgi:ornithine decarboxylase
MTTARPSSLLRPGSLRPAALAHLDYPTPYLMMDLATVGRQYRRFRELLPDVAVHYAVKCNPDPRLVAYLRSLGSRFEIASSAELRMLTAQGVPPSEIIYSNPVRPAAHIEAAAAAGVGRFAADSEAELGKLARYAPGASVYIRLATAPANSKVPSEGKFGVTPGHAISLLRQAADLGLKPYGLAFHVGSQMQDPGEFGRAIERAGRIMSRLQDDGITLGFLDMGGGFPAHYQDDAPDLAGHATAINAALAEHLPYRVNLAIEPGRALVGNAGVMVTSVIGVADRAGRRWVHVDAGAFNGFMESLETQNRLLFPLADSRASAHQGVFNLTGPSCDSQDTIMFGIRLSAGIRPGDLVYVYAAGAYTTSYASRFNGFDIPQTYCLPVPAPGRRGPAAGRPARSLGPRALPVRRAAKRPRPVPSCG